MLAHGTGICPLEILAAFPVLSALWATRGVWLARLGFGSTKKGT